MKLAGIRELRSNTAALLGGTEPVLVTRRGKISGLYVPLETADKLPDDLGREISRAVGEYLSQLLDACGVSEEDVQKDFDACRRRR